MTIREELEQMERENLSEFATLKRKKFQQIN